MVSVCALTDEAYLGSQVAQLSASSNLFRLKGNDCPLVNYAERPAVMFSISDVSNMA